jgi:hypothetical protein
MRKSRLPLARARGLLVGAVAAAALLAAAASALAARGAPPATARDLASAFFSNTLTRAEVVSVVGKTVHDYRVDEGKVVAVRAGAVDLLERDGTLQTIRMGAATLTIGKVSRVLGPVVPRSMRVVALRDGGGPATQIRPAGQAQVLGRLLLGAALVRAEIVSYSAKTLHDVRIDDGRIVAVHANALTLLELDGTRQSIPVGPATLVTTAGRPAGLGAAARGLYAITIRDGDGPAQEVRLTLSKPLAVVGRR